MGQKNRLERILFIIMVSAYIFILVCIPFSMKWTFIAILLFCLLYIVNILLYMYKVENKALSLKSFIDIMSNLSRMSKEELHNQNYSKSILYGIVMPILIFGFMVFVLLTMVMIFIYLRNNI